jgi:hypothetical protein
LEDPDIEGRIMLQLILNKRDRNGLDVRGSRQGHVNGTVNAVVNLGVPLNARNLLGEAEQPFPPQGLFFTEPDTVG